MRLTVADRFEVVEPFDRVDVLEWKFCTMPNREFIEELCWDGVACAGKGVIECDEGNGAIVVAEVQCFAQSVLPEPISELPERVCFGGEDNQGADVVSPFTLEGRNEMVDNLSFLKGDEEEVSHWFLGYVTFNEGIHTLMDTF